MTNNYDTPHHIPDSLSLDPSGTTQFRVSRAQTNHLERGQLSSALRLAAQEAQTKANRYDAMAKQLNLLADQEDTTE